MVFLVFVLATWSVGAAELVGRATITDGDTLTLAKKRIRLWGIDAPESAQQCTTQDGHSWPCGRRSAAALDGYLWDKTVRCQPKDTDRYGRVVAECFVQGQSVNRWMVRSAGRSRIGNTPQRSSQTRPTRVSSGATSGRGLSRCLPTTGAASGRKRARRVPLCRSYPAVAASRATSPARARRSTMCPVSGTTSAPAST